MIDLSEFSNPWFSLLQRHRMGKRIEKGEVLALLSSDSPVINEAKPFIADVINGSHKFPRGIKPQSGIDSNMGREFIRGLVDMLEEHFKDENTDRPKGAETPREMAKKSIANGLGVSVRTIESVIEGAAQH